MGCHTRAMKSRRELGPADKRSRQEQEQQQERQEVEQEESSAAMSEDARSASQPASDPPVPPALAAALQATIAEYMRQEQARAGPSSSNHVAPIIPSAAIEDAQRAQTILNEASEVVGDALGGLGGSAYQRGPSTAKNLSTRLELKAVDKSLKWKGFHDARKPILFLSQLADQQAAARASCDDDKWAVARYLMENTAYELLTNAFPLSAPHQPFSAFQHWFLTTYETKTLTVRNWECLQALAEVHSAVDTFKTTIQESLARFEAEASRLVGVAIPDLQKIYLFHKRLPAWAHKATIVDPVTKDMFSNWQAYRTNLLSYAASMRSAPAPQPHVHRTRPQTRPALNLNSMRMKRRATKPSAAAPSTYAMAAAAAAPSASAPAAVNAVHGSAASDPEDRRAFLMWYKDTKLQRWFDFHCLNRDCKVKGGCPPSAAKPLTPELRALHAGEWQQVKRDWMASRRQN